MTLYDAYFIPIVLLGCLTAGIVSFIAGWMSGYVWRAVLLLIGVVALWIALFLGSDLGYRAWQSMPDPPDEAFSDASAAGALVFGWFPAGIFCLTIFGMARGVRWFLHWANPDEFPRDSKPATKPPAEPIETGNPYQGPSGG